MVYKPNKEKTIVNGALSLLISSILVKFLGLIYKIPLSHILGDEGMSHFNSAYTVYTFFYIICTAGIPKSISIIVSKHIGNNKQSEAIKVTKIAFIIFSIFGALISLIFFASSKSLSTAIGNNDSYYSMLAVAPSVAFICANGVLRGYYNGTFSFVPIALSEIITALSRLIFGLIFAYIAIQSGLPIRLVSAYTILGSTIGSVLTMFYLCIGRKSGFLWNNLRQKADTASLKKTATDILKIAIPITLTGALSSIGAILDLSVIMNLLKNGGYSNLQTNIIYGNYSTLVTPMVNLVAAVIAPITTILLPTVASCKDDFKSLTKSVSNALIIALALSIPSTAALIVMPNEILSLLFEDTSAALAAPLLAYIAPSLILMSILSVINTTLEARGNTTIPLISLLVGTLIKLIVTFIINYNGDFGIIGAPIGSVLFYLVGFIISYCYAVVSMKIKINIFKSLIKLLFSAIASSLLTIYLKYNIEHKTTVNSLLFMFIFTVIYIVTLFLSGFLKEYLPKKRTIYTKNH